VTLAEWMAANGWTNARLADVCAVTEEAVRQWRHGRHRPSKRAVRIIVKLTENQVTEKDFKPNGKLG